MLLRQHVAPELPSNPRILHLAPEPGIEHELRRLGPEGYVSGDIEPGRALRQLDLTDLPFADSSLDLVFASHVLEHIEDDGQALREIFRALRPKGLAFLDVPVLRRNTFEDPATTDPRERLRVFGQEDHVRMCGVDYGDRFAQAGFEVRSLWIPEQFDADVTSRMRLVVERGRESTSAMPEAFEEEYDVCWLCRKPQALPVVPPGP